MNSLPAFHFLEPRPLIKALVKTAKVKINLGSWQGLSIIAIGPRNGKIVGYKSNGKPIYAGSAAAQQLVAILQAKHTYTPAQQDVALVKWLMELGLQGAVDAEQVHLSKEGASLLQEAFSVTPQPLGGGKWKVAKASLLPHLGEPLRPSEEQETGWAAEMASGQYGDGSFPALSELKELPAGKFSGSHGNKLFESKGGHKWVFKAADPIIARAEEAACRLGRLLLGNLIPAVKYVEVQGKGGALIQILDGQTWQESSSQHSDPQMENLKKYKALIMKHQVVDWLISNHDSHAGNFLSQGGQLAAIDKGQSWKFLGKDKLEADYSPNPSHPIYNKFWEKIKSGEIDSAGLIEAVADVVNRADQISPEQFQLIVAPYVSTVSGWTHADPQAQLQKMLARLQNLRSDFEGFLSTELGKKVVLPKPETVQVAWETPPEGEPAAKPKAKPKHGPTKLEIPLTAVAAVTPVVPGSPPKLKAVEVAPVVAGKPKAGWPLTKKGGKSVEVTIHTPGVVPASWWPSGVPAPGMKLTTAYKGKQYGLEVGENWEGKKPSFVVTYPDGKMVGFTSLNAAGDSLYLFNQGLPLTLSATEKKAKGISLGSKVFQLKLFEQELAEAAGKAEEPPAPVTQTVAELEEQKVVAPEQPVVAAMQLLHDWTNGQVVTGQFLPLEIQEWLVANSGKEHYTTAWDLPLPPGVAVKVSDSEVGTLILTARVSKVGKPEMWGWWEGLDGTVKNGVLGKLQIDVLAHKFELWAGESLADKLGSYKATAALAEKDKETLAKFPAGPPPEAILPPTAVVPENAPKFTEGPLAKGTVIKVKKKVPGYEKKQEVTLSVLQNGQLLVEIPGQTAQTFQTLSAASDHVWIVQKGYSDAADYKAKNKTNKVPSGGGWKFWGISPKEAPAASAAELGTGAGAVPAPVLPVPSVPEPGAATPAGAESLAPTIGGATLEFLEAAAYGTKIQTDDGNDNKTVYEKLFGGKWKVTLINKFASADTAEITTAEAYNMMQDEKIESWEGPGAPVPEEMVQITSAVDALAGALGPKDEYDWHPLKDVTGAVIDALPEGTTISWKSPWEKGSHQAEKTKGGQWTFTVAPNTEAGPYGTHPSIELLDHVIIGSEPKVLLPVFDYQAPKKPATTSGGPIPPPSLEQIKAYPLGTKVHVNVTSHPTYVYVKTEAGWSNLESGNTYKDLTVANSWKQPFNEITKIEVPEKESIFDALPGFAWKEGVDKVPEKEGEPSAENWEWFKFHPIEAASKIKAAIKNDPEALGKLPAGTLIQYSIEKKMDSPIVTAVKTAKGDWDVTWEDEKKELHELAYMQSVLSYPDTIIKMLKAPSKLNLAPITELPVTGDFQAELAALEKTGDFTFLPKNTIIQSQSKNGSIEYKYVKESDNYWKKYSDGTNVGSLTSDVVATELKDEVIISWTKPGGAPIFAKKSPKGLPTTEEEFAKLPVGTFIQTKGKYGHFYTYLKDSSDNWVLTADGVTLSSGSNGKVFSDIQEETLDAWKAGSGKVPEKPEVPKGITTITLNDYPVGTVIQAQAGTSFYKYTKKPDGEWLVEGSQGTNSYPASLLATELFYEKVLEVAPPASKNPAAWEEFEKLAEGAFLAKQTVTISDYTPYLEDDAKFSALPVGTVIETKSKTNNTYTYTKHAANAWKAVSGGGQIYELPDANALGDLVIETILSWQQPIGVPGFPENVHTDYSKFPEAVQKTLEKIKEGVVAGSKPTGGANHSTIEKPSGWPAWVPPPGVVISGEWQGKKFYLLNGQYGYVKNTDDPNVLIQFAVVGEDGVFHVGGSDENADDALAYALSATDVGTSVTEVKEQLGLNKLSFPVGSNFYNLSGTQSPLAGKPVAQMTPAEKVTKVKTSMYLVDALKNHPLLQEGTLKFKKAKGTAMYVCLDGVEGASTKLYNALKELNVEHHIKNKGGIPKVNAQGAFVAIDGQVLQFTQVEVETTALEASSVKHAPSDPNWQTMPEAKAKPKKKTKAQLAAEKEAAAKFEAAKQKAVAIKAWGTTHPPVVDKGQLQTLAYLQKDFASYQIPVGVIARTAGEELVLSHKTHQKQFAYYLKILHEATPFQMETIETPWGEAVKLDVAGLQKALEQKFKVGIGKMITGPDGKEYPDGTTFQKKTFKHTVSDLISSEPGFYKIKEHATDPVNLAFLKVVGTSPESMAQMKAIIAKYGLESPHPEPKLGSGSVVHSIFKKSLEKVFSVEETYAVDVPEQPEEFVQSGLPSVDTGEYWSEVGDGSADLADVASIKPSLYGHVMRVGAPGELRDFCIRFRRVKDKQGKLYYEFTGDLVNFNSGKSELSTGTAQFGSILGSKGTEPDGGSTDVATFDPETGTHTEYTPKISSAPTPGGFCGKTESGSSILVVPPSSSQDTFKNTFRVRIPATENPLSELREAFQKMGKDPDKMLAPINEDSDRIFKKSMLVRGLMGAKGWNEDSFSPMTMHDEAWLDGQLSKLGAKGKVEGLRVVKTFDNHISVIADDAEKFQKWSFPYVGASLSGTFLQLIQGSGWASRKNCLVHGVWHSGQSPGPDIQSGGSKGVFCRVAGVNSVVSESYACQIIFSPRLFKRVDWWRYNADGYGNTNSHQAHGSSVTYGKKRYETDLNGLNEILFEGGVGLKDIVAVVVDDSDERKQMIAALKKAGKTEINGKSLEDFIVGKVHKGVSAFGTAADFAKALEIAPVE
jgi:hypothetical protein